MRRGPGARACIVEVVGLRLGAREKLGDRVDAELGVDHDRIWRGAELGDRREILERIVWHGRIEAGIDDIGTRGDEQRVTVSLRVRGISDPDIAAGAGAIFHDHMAGQRGAEVLPEDSRHDVGRARRRKRHDDLDRPLGVAGRQDLRRPERGSRGYARRKACGFQKLPA